MSRRLDSSTTTQMAYIMVQYGTPSRSSWAKSVRSSFGRTIMGKAIWEDPIEAWLGEKFQIGNAYKCTVKKGLFLSVYVDDIKVAGKKSTNREVHLVEPTSFLDHVYLGCTQRLCEISKDIVDNYKTMFESRISAGATENYHARKIWVSLRCPMTWKVMLRNVWNDIVSWQTRRLNNSTKYQFHALMTITSKKKNWNPLKNCQKCALKLLWNAYTWHGLEDPDVLRSVNKLARSIAKMDQTLWQTPESLYILHSSHKWVQTILLCE